MASVRLTAAYMGILGLWPLMEAASKQIECTEDLKGLRLGVDVSVLIHAAIAAPDIAEDMVLRGIPAPPHAVQKVVRVFEQLCDWGAQPYAFFDGDTRPYKREEAASRSERREAAMTRATQLYESSSGNTGTEYRKLLRKEVRSATHVTPELRNACALQLAILGFPVIGSPFEADGQLAWAFRKGQVDAVMTIDSDLLALGCKVIRLPHTSPFEWMKSKKLHIYDIPSLECSLVAATPDKLDMSWAVAAYGSHVLIVYACLCGCDYNQHKGFRYVGQQAAWSIIKKVGGEGDGRSPADSWGSDELIEAIRSAGYKSKSQVVASLPEHPSMMVEHVRDAFLQQPVCWSADTGFVGALCGVAFSQFQSPELTREELIAAQAKCWAANIREPAHSSPEDELQVLMQSLVM